VLNFKKTGKGEKTLVFLHGWSKDLSSWDEVVDQLKDEYTCYALDLPGFGKSPLSRPYGLEDYAEDIKGFLVREKVSRAILVGHSYGGRVAIKLASGKPEFLDKLILVDSAGIKSRSWKIKILKFVTNFTPRDLKDGMRFLWPYVASEDYRGSFGLLRETMKKVVEEDLAPALEKISAPTLIVWGESDHTTPLWMGRLMHEGIRGSKLVIIPGGDHGVPYRRSKEVAKTISEFLHD